MISATGERKEVGVIENHGELVYFGLSGRKVCGRDSSYVEIQMVRRNQPCDNTGQSLKQRKLKVQRSEV